MDSIWMQDYIKRDIPSLENNMTTPVLIIGGGIAGLSCAYNLLKNNIPFVLVDAKKLAGGVSASTTAQVSIAHDNLYDEISKKHGEDKAIAYLKAQIEGLNLIKQVINKEKIKCDFKEESTILYTNEDKNIEVINEQFKIIKDYADCDLLENNKSINFKKGLEVKNQFIFNPMKYMMGIIDVLIKNNASMYEKSKVTKINKKDNGYEVVINNKYWINTEKIVMACHYPFINPDNLYFTKIYQSKSYAIAFKTKLKLKANYVSLDEPYYYLRTYDKNTLIIGGCDHYTGIDNDIRACYEKLIKKIYELDLNAMIEDRWFTEDCMTTDSLPFVDKYSNKNPNIYLITGFNKWGFTNSHIAAKNITNMLTNNSYDHLCSTDRPVLLKNMKETLRMVAHSINGLVISKLLLKKYNLSDIEIGSGKAMKFEGINVLVYREDKNKYIFLKNKCTHMGCSLIWNDIDKLWESRCHGSIFDKYGHVIYGPAIKNLEVLDLKIIDDKKQ